jgi:hypothetical protein
LCFFQKNSKFKQQYSLLQALKGLTINENSSYKSFFRVALCLSIVVCCLTKTTFAQYPGTNTRGRVLTVNIYNQQVPLVGARIDLYIFDGRFPVGQQWRLLATSFTDIYGFYYFRYVPPNNYTIQINQLKSYNISVIAIDYRFYTYQDLPLFFY